MLFKSIALLNFTIYELNAFCVNRYTNIITILFKYDKIAEKILWIGKLIIHTKTLLTIILILSNPTVLFELTVRKRL